MSIFIPKLNPLLPYGNICSRIVIIFILKEEGIIEKTNSYESVDDIPILG